MADDYSTRMNAMRREGQDESAARFKEMAGGVGSIGLPSRMGEPRRPAPEVTAPPPLEKPAVLMDGTSKYVYERVDADTFKIVKSPHSQGGQIVTRTSSPSAFAAIQDDVAKVAMMKSNGLWDAEKGAPKFEAQIKGASTSPKARVEALTEEMTLEAPMTSAAPAPMPMMAGTTYGSAQPAATQSSKVPPPPSQTPGRGQRALSDEIGVALDTLRSPSTPGGMGSPERNSNRTASGEASKVLGDYRSGVQLESNARSVIDGLVRNKMDPQAAKALVDGLRAQGAAGAEALRSLAGGLFDERIMVATGRK